MYKNRETSEWSNFWWDNAEKEGMRVLLVGDSISCGYHKHCVTKLEGKYFVDLLGTSKFVADKSFKTEFNYFLNEYDYYAIHFNNGLHGITLSNDDYEVAYREMIKLALTKCKNIIITTSTPITTCDDLKKLDEIKNAVVLARNEIVIKIAEEFSLPIDNLYNVVVGNKEIKSDDGYHYFAEGYDLLSNSVITSIK